MMNTRLTSIFGIFFLFALGSESANMSGKICPIISNLYYNCVVHEGDIDPLSFLHDHTMNNYLRIKSLAINDHITRACNYFVYSMSEICAWSNLDFLFERIAPHVSELLGLGQLHTIDEFMVHNETIINLLSDDPSEMQPLLAMMASFFNYVPYFSTKNRITFMILTLGCRFISPAMQSDLPLGAQLLLNQTCMGVP